LSPWVPRSSVECRWKNEEALLLAGTGTAQTQMDYDAEVDFGLQQLALTQEKGPLAADAKKVKLEAALADVKKTTEALAQGLGGSTGGKRRPPSKQLRDAGAECAAAFNAVHDELSWFIGRMPQGAERDGLEALLMSLEALLSRNPPAAPTPAVPEPPPAPPENNPA
jgi:hypothetical protein